MKTGIGGTANMGPTLGSVGRDALIGYCAMVTIGRQGNDLIVDARHLTNEHPVARTRVAEIMRVVARTLARIGEARCDPARYEARVTVPVGESAQRVDLVLKTLGREVTRIVQRPCTPKHVVELLSITTHERLRWTKDGRLKVGARISLRRHNGGVCPTYSVHGIVELLRHPETIEQWRRLDADAIPEVTGALPLVNVNDGR